MNMKDCGSDLQSSVLKLSIVSSFMTPFMISAVNVALPSIAKELHCNSIILSWIAASYLLTTAMFLLPSGKLADIKGRKRVFKYGIMIFTFFSLLSSVAINSSMLILFRMLQGIGGAMIFSTATAILTAVFPPDERGKVLGFTVSSVYIGLSVGPFFGGYISQILSWRMIFLIIVPLGVYLLYLIDRRVDIEWIFNNENSFDLIGSILYGIAIFMVMSGLSMITDIIGKMFLIAGLVVLVIFLFYERGHSNPVLNIDLFLKNKTFFLSNISALINYSATFSVTFLLSLYLQYIKGVSSTEAGLILLFQPVVMATVSPIAGKLSDKINPGLLASLGMVITSLALFLFSLLSFRTHVLYILLVLMFLGLGFAFFSSPNANAIMSSVEKNMYGTASAMMGTMRLLGQMFSMGMATFFISIFLGDKRIIDNPYIYLQVMNYNFIVVSILAFIGIFTSIFRGNLKKSE
ncbi:MAG: MFS transporter [Calditerrivibrio sp.]|nr:MFS transporter [Calditerrivibrio sp.]